VRQEKLLADYCQRGVLTPNTDIQCRYRIVGTTVDVDVISPDGFNVGGTSVWLKRAAERAGRYEVEPGRTVRGATPAHFLATKLVALGDRADDVLSSKDAEDIVAVFVEIPSLIAEVQSEGIADELAELWSAALSKLALTGADLPDVVDAHLHREDRMHRDRVIRALQQLLALR
jgi:hypothetical protein